MSIGDGRSTSSSESKSSDPDKTSYRSSSSSLDESGMLNVNKMLRNSTPENEIVFAWLREFSYENYAENFINNGYDIQTIVRMTPEVNIDCRLNMKMCFTTKINLSLLGFNSYWHHTSISS